MMHFLYINFLCRSDGLFASLTWLWNSSYILWKFIDGSSDHVANMHCMTLWLMQSSKTKHYCYAIRKRIYNAHRIISIWSCSSIQSICHWRGIKKMIFGFRFHRFDVGWALLVILMKHLFKYWWWNHWIYQHNWICPHFRWARFIIRKILIETQTFSSFFFSVISTLIIAKYLNRKMRTEGNKLEFHFSRFVDDQT